MKIKKEEYKVQAFADDLVFIIEDPLETGSKLLREIEEFGTVVGLKINKEKTKILTKNCTIRQNKELEEKLGIQITKKVKYLGIWVTAKCSSIKEDKMCIRDSDQYVAMDEEQESGEVLEEESQEDQQVEGKEGDQEIRERSDRDQQEREGAKARIQRETRQRIGMRATSKQ